MDLGLFSVLGLLARGRPDEVIECGSAPRWKHWASARPIDRVRQLARPPGVGLRVRPRPNGMIRFERVDVRAK